MPKGRRSKKSSKSSIDIQVVLLIVISIILAILIYTKSGYIGENLTPFLGGLIGWVKYILPIGTFMLGIYLAIDKDKEYLSKKLIQYAILIICISIIVSVYQVSIGNLKIDTDTMETVKEAYNYGRESIGGGALGALFAIPLIGLIGELSTVILAIGGAIITSIFLFGIKPAEILKQIIENRNEKREEGRQYKEEARKERNENAKLKSKDKKSDIEEEKDNQKNNDIMENQIDIKLSNQSNLFKKAEQTKEDRTKEILVLEHNLTEEDKNYEFPPIEFLNEGKLSVSKNSKKTVAETANKLQRTLYNFGVSAKVESVSVGPTITRYELKPAEGVRVNKIANLADDIALNLAAETIRIEAPIPGKQAVRNRNPK